MPTLAVGMCPRETFHAHDQRGHGTQSVTSLAISAVADLRFNLCIRRRKSRRNVTGIREKPRGTPPVKLLQPVHFKQQVESTCRIQPLDDKLACDSMNYMNTLSVRIPDDLMADLQEISSQQSVPVSDLVRESIRRYVAVERFRSLRKRTLLFAEAQGLLTDDDVFRVIS